MLRRKVFTLLVGLSALVPSVCADDLPFGGDTLGQLAEEAELVVAAAKPKLLAIDPAKSGLNTDLVKYVLFSVEVTKVIKGSARVREEVRVAFPDDVEPKAVDELSNSILFLRPFAPEDLKWTNLPEGERTYFAVSGVHGVVSAEEPLRMNAVQAYVASVKPFASDETLFSWTQQYLNSSDPFLQKSAVVDLYFARDKPAAMKQLGQAVLSGAVRAENKITAIQALEKTNSFEAARSVQTIAEDPRAPITVRKFAVEAFETLPGGESILQGWSAGGDRFLAPAAKSSIESIQHDR